MFVIRPITTASKQHSIHGFIGSIYGSKARIIACIATVIGYVLNCGYEMYWSSRIFALSTGLDNWALPIALMLTGVCGAYCMIDGFKANSTTDKAQNILGMFAKKKNVSRHMSFWGTSSILVGILSAVLPFLYVLFTSSEDISSWSPIFALIGSILVFSLGSTPLVTMQLVPFYCQSRSSSFVLVS